MSYTRVIPRDLFNESKLLKCLGQLALLIHDRRLPIELEHNTEDSEGFEVLQDSDTGGLFCANLRAIANGVEVQLRSVYNSKSNYPLVFTDAEGGEALVFDEAGKPSVEFLNHIGLVTA